MEGDKGQRSLVEVKLVNSVLKLANNISICGQTIEWDNVLVLLLLLLFIVFWVKNGLANVIGLEDPKGWINLSYTSLLVLLVESDEKLIKM